MEESCKSILADEEQEGVATTEDDFKAALASFREPKPICANLCGMTALWRAIGSEEQRSHVCEHADVALSHEQLSPKLRNLLRATRLGRGTWVK